MLSRHIRDKKPSDSIRRRRVSPFARFAAWNTMRQRSWPGSQKKQDGKEERVHSLIVPIQLFPTSQRDIPGSPRRKNTREDGGRTAIRWGGGEKKKEGKKRIVASANCLSLFFFFSRGRKLEEKYSARKIKVTRERVSLLLSYLLRRTKDFSFYTKEMLEGLNLFCNLNGIVIKSRDCRICLWEKEGGEVREKARRSWQARLSTNRIVVMNAILLIRIFL